MVQLTWRRSRHVRKQDFPYRSPQLDSRNSLSPPFLQLVQFCPLRLAYPVSAGHIAILARFALPTVLLQVGHALGAISAEEGFEASIALDGGVDALQMLPLNNVSGIKQSFERRLEYFLLQTLDGPESRPSTDSVPLLLRVFSGLDVLAVLDTVLIGIELMERTGQL